MSQITEEIRDRILREPGYAATYEAGQQFLNDHTAEAERLRVEREKLDAAQAELDAKQAQHVGKFQTLCGLRQKADKLTRRTDRLQMQRDDHANYCESLRESLNENAGSQGGPFEEGHYLLSAVQTIASGEPILKHLDGMLAALKKERASAIKTAAKYAQDNGLTGVLPIN